MPMRARRCGGMWVIKVPLNWISPDVAGRMPINVRKSVVLPKNADELACADIQRQSGENRDAVIARTQVGDFQHVT